MNSSTKTIFTVDGMTCGHCVSHVTKAFSEVPGVKSSVVDLAQKTATVEHEAGASEDEMLAALSDAGYQATVRRPD